tara:strand:+ start:1170 stop:1967 length:798 start_codon:yes stop_codon:yes gene_type:complete
MNKGYVMIATGEECVKQAYLCAKSIKHTQTINNVSLLTSDNISEQYKDVFDKIINIPTSDRNKQNFYRTDIRWKAFHDTPYEETVVLDTDMIFLDDISHWWSYLSNYDLCFTKNVRTYKNTNVTNNFYRKTFTQNNIPNIYCAFHYFKQNDTALNYYLKLEKVCRNYKEYYKIYTPKFTPTVSSMDLNHAITILDEQIKNYVFEPASFVHMKSHVQNWQRPQEDWTECIPFYFSKDKKLKIGNYLQHGIIHYTKNNFCERIFNEY